ncbi:bile acid:sodium symporter family protein [Qipengyuania gaetbuli]|uniref:bile acid:sodium symporter family protein n=1 Tax=Qipengyuania gaetbuli TaxID=266952 RepID=UPI001CD2D0BB|nr:bile acid:sodium symporter family protein [Qipengyuania gaetbuli]MCA0911080.1 bile acid:sodium symporter [Qipengyuania gaetbuli]
MALASIARDPMIRFLAIAIAAAALVPATGSAREIAQQIANGAIFLLFLLNGLRIDRQDILAGIANWRFLLPLVLWVFGAMAIAGLGLSLAANSALPAVVALGFLYLGALPSTVQSATSYTSLSGGTVALSVVSAALLNIIGVFVTVPIFLALGGSGEGAVGNEVIVKILTILVLPFAIGQVFQKPAARFTAGNRQRIVWIDRFVIAVAVYVAFSGAVEQGLWSRMDGSGWTIVLALVGLFLAIGHLGAWAAGGMLGLRREDRIAFLFAGAQKSAAVGAPLATILFPPAVAGFIVMPLLLYHLFQLVLAAPLSTRLARQPRPGCDGCTAPTTRS